jgi:hypothetical protein
MLARGGLPSSDVTPLYIHIIIIIIIIKIESKIKYY